MERKCQFYEWASSYRTVWLCRRKHNVCLHAIMTVYEHVHVTERLTVACVFHIHSCMKWTSVHSYSGVCLLHLLQGHLSIQLLWADLHQQSICIFPDDAAVPLCCWWCCSQPQFLQSYFSFHSPVKWALCELREILTCIQYDPDSCRMQVWSRLQLICICHKQAWQIYMQRCLSYNTWGG